MGAAECGVVITEHPVHKDELATLLCSLESLRPGILKNTITFELQNIKKPNKQCLFSPVHSIITKIKNSGDTPSGIEPKVN